MSMPTCDEWIQALSKNNGDRGLAATTQVDIDQYEDQFEQARVGEADQELALRAAMYDMAQDDRRGMTTGMKCAKKRRAWPWWGAPLEALLMAMAPSYCRAD